MNNIRFLLLGLFFLLSAAVYAQQEDSRKTAKQQKREERRRKINEMIRQSEEGVLLFSKQTVLGAQLRTNGYGIFFETGRMKTAHKTQYYSVDFTEIKHPKENKQSNNGFLFGNPYIYAKENYFYQLKPGYGEQIMLGQKGNKNGIAVFVKYGGGLSLGLLRPYYLEVEDPSTPGRTKIIKYTSADSALFLGTGIIGGTGFTKGWNEIKLRPGLFVKSSLSFDFARFNETVSGVEIGVSADVYFSKIPIMVKQKQRQFFFQGHIALLFGHRRN
ncbi:MAG: hypothetical protein N2747_08095 [Chitinophagaceae bacterium]|nr:hypothetical protein [Chitinophagaceae bacterium]